jgi:hypothetical protein
MKRFLFIFCILLFTSRLFAQQFSQYNTGTLYDSFENPSQRSFIPDSSRQFASNFFFPNIDANGYFTGNAQQTLKDRLFSQYYNNKSLVIENGPKYNHAYGNANVYLFMFKIFGSLNGNTELGFSAQTKFEGRGVVTDQSVALLNGSFSFKDGNYMDLFNSNYRYQLYNIYGITYREQITKKLAFGIKLGYVSGMNEENVNINNSNVFFDKKADTAELKLAGTNQKTSSFSVNPFHNPGLSVTIGTAYKTRDAFLIQANIKDFGFIHWSTGAETFYIDNSATIFDLTSPQRENNVVSTYKHVIEQGKKVHAFNTPLNGVGELSVNKQFWLDGDYKVKYSPTLIASKELFYSGFTATLINPVQYKNYTVTATASYNDLRLLYFGGQFMVKSANAEFFIGSDRLAQSGRIFLSTLGSRKEINQSGSFSGTSLFLGFSLKFGHIIEHPMNASTIPMGDEKGFLGRMWDKVFNPNAGLLKNN